MENFVDGKTYFNVKQVAEMFKVNPETVKRWAREDILEKQKGSGRSGYLFSDEALDKFAAGRPKYSVKKARYDTVERIKRKTREDILMDMMAQLARMKVKFYYDGVADEKPKTYIEGWGSCADEFENYIRGLIMEMR